MITICPRAASLSTAQAASVSTGLPFAAVLLLGCYALVRGLLSEPRK